MLAVIAYVRNENKFSTVRQTDKHKGFFHRKDDFSNASVNLMASAPLNFRAKLQHLMGWYSIANDKKKLEKVSLYIKNWITQMPNHTRKQLGWLLDVSLYAFMKRIIFKFMTFGCQPLTLCCIVCIKNNWIKFKIMGSSKKFPMSTGPMSR